jgi:hypothetical protein
LSGPVFQMLSGFSHAFLFGWMGSEWAIRAAYTLPRLLLAAAGGPCGASLTRVPSDLSPALRELAVTVPAALPLLDRWADEELPFLVSSSMWSSWASQKFWSQAVDEALAAAFDAEASVRLVQLRRLQAGAHAGTWLTSLPNPLDEDSTLSAPEWQALLRFRLGIPLAGPCRCSGCGEVADRFGDHALSCSRCGLYARHNRVRDALALEAVLAGEQVRLEKGPPSSSLRPGDVLCLDFSDSVLAVDTTVVHPLHPSARAAEDTPGAAAARAEERKVSAEAPVCRAAGWLFEAAGVETTGSWGPSAQRFVRKLIRKQSMRSGECPPQRWRFGGGCRSLQPKPWR